MSEASTRFPPFPSQYSAELDALVARRGGFFVFSDDLNGSVVAGFLRQVIGRYEVHLRYAKERLYLERPRLVQYGFILNTSIGAFATTSETEAGVPFDFIGINIGTVLTLWDLFSRILSHPENFPEVGRPELEVAARCEVPYLSIDIISSGLSACAPKCEVRRSFAAELSFIALDFLFLHELSHLRNGHLEYVRSNLNVSLLVEMVGEAGTPISVLQQALEMDADAGALLQTLIFLCNTRDRLGRLGENPHPVVLQVVTAVYGTTAKIVRTLQFVTYIFFRLFDAEWQWQLQANVSHPMPSVRMCWVAETLAAIFDQRTEEYGYTRDEFVADAEITLVMSERAMALIQGKEIDLAPLMSVVESPVYVQYLNQLAEAWAQARPTLDLSKRGGVLAPSQVN